MFVVVNKRNQSNVSFFFVHRSLHGVFKKNQTLKSVFMLQTKPLEGQLQFFRKMTRKKNKTSVRLNCCFLFQGGRGGENSTGANDKLHLSSYLFPVLKLLHCCFMVNYNTVVP